MKTEVSLQPLLEVVTTLMAPDGCPWDSVQTHQSMRRHMLEEAYEVCDAIDQKDAVNLREELGDVLFQVAFHASLAEKEGLFDLQAVIDEVTEKMKRRHPKIYAIGDAVMEKMDWEDIKRIEKEKHPPKTVVPMCLPATMKLEKLVGKLQKQGVEKAEIEGLCTNQQQRDLLALVFQSRQGEESLENSAEQLAQRLLNELEKGI